MALSFFKKWVFKIISVSKSDDAFLKEESRFLCIDDDRTFCSFLKRLSHPLRIKMDAAHSIAEAKQIIEKNPGYDAFIIDGHLPDGAGFELVAWIREKMNLSTPIGFISRIYRDAKTFRLLRDKLNVNYVFEKPIRPAEIHQLLLKLSQPDTASSFPDSFSNILIENLKAVYDETISDKIESLEKKIIDVEKNPTAQHLATLRKEVNKIAGSAASFGYRGVSKLCKSMESEIKDQIDLAKKNRFNRKWLSNLDDFFTQIKLHFQMDFQINGLAAGVQFHQLPSLYIVDEDEALLHDFSRYSNKLHYEVLTESDPRHAVQNLLAADFYPQIFLLNTLYKKAQLSGYDLLKTIYQSTDYLTAVVGFIAEAEEDLKEGLQKGITFMTEKPVPVRLVFHLLDQTPFRAFPLPYKILAIDEDPDICQYILQTLKYAGLDVQTLQDINEIESTIKEFQPDLLLLEINLAEGLDVEVLNKVRKKFKKLIIGMISVTEDDTTQQCFDAGVDEIIFKPLDKSILQRKIAGLLKKKAYETIGLEEDLNRNDSKNILLNYLAKLQKMGQPPFPKSLVLFEVENAEGEMPDLGEDIFDDLLKKHELAVSLGDGKFALVFQGFDPHFIQLFMRTYLLNLKNQLTKKHGKEIFINESLHILSGKNDAATSLQFSEELLKAAKNMPDRMIIESSFVPLKEVFIIHKREKPFEKLKELFKKETFAVRFKNEIEKDLFSSVIPLPLLILTDTYGDLEGLPLLKEWWMENLIQVPVIILSHWPDDNKLYQLLSEVNYFTAPFSLVILVHEESTTARKKS